MTYKDIIFIVISSLMLELFSFLFIAPEERLIIIIPTVSFGILTSLWKSIEFPSINYWLKEWLSKTGIDILIIYLGILLIPSFIFSYFIYGNIFIRSMVIGSSITIFNAFAAFMKSEIMSKDNLNSNYKQKQVFNIEIENLLQKIYLESWNKTSESYFDIIETIPDELEKWKKHNLKYVAYLVVAWDFLGFIRYFITTAISNAITKLAEGIATRKVSS